MSYKVVIPAAGIGSRLEDITKYISKALVPLGGVAAISRIMDMFPENTEFVVAAGYKGELLKEYLHLAYAKQKITVCDVSPYEGAGSGLGYSLLCCREYLQEPFVFCSCDTLVDEIIPKPEKNWMGYGIRENLSRYRTVHAAENGIVENIGEKGADESAYAKPYIGLAGIHDYEQFWNYMESGADEAVNMGEAYALRKMLEDGQSIEAVKFTWSDTGVKEELRRTCTKYQNSYKRKARTLEAWQMEWIINDKYIFFSDKPEEIDAFIMQNHEDTAVLNRTTHMVSYRRNV